MTLFLKAGSSTRCEVRRRHDRETLPLALLLLILFSVTGAAAADENGSTYQLGPFTAAGRTADRAEARMYAMVELIELSLPPQDSLIDSSCTRNSVIPKGSTLSNFRCWSRLARQRDGP